MKSRKERKKPKIMKISLDSIAKQTGKWTKTKEERLRNRQQQGINNKVDYLTLGLFVALLLISLFVLNSASTNVVDGDPDYYVRKQATFMVAGAVLFFIVMLFDYRRYREYTHIGYVGIIILLILVWLFGSGDGANRWIFGFQPSELAKLVMIITFAAWLADNRERLKEPKVVGKGMLFMMIPMFLIFIEPDLGTSLVFVFIMLIMLYVAGANRKVLFTVVGSLLAFATLIYVSLYFYTDGFNKMLEDNIPFLPLHTYQLMRLVIFINPQMDPYDSGYHIIQSKIAIGSGGIFGKGYGDGTQVQGNFLPAHHTDFIFSVLGEEMGFLFTAFVLVIYMVFLIRLMRAAYLSRDFFGTLIVTGICSMLAFQIIVNAGMAMGIMPITGLPLPFFSYGVTSLWVNMMSVGVVFSILLRGKKPANQGLLW